MTADAEGVLLRPAVRDIRVVRPREVYHPEFGSPFTGVLALAPWRADWPASGLSFLRLIPHLLPTIREMGPRSLPDATTDAIDEPVDNDEEAGELRVRDLLTEASSRLETSASLRDSPTAHLVHRVGADSVSGPALDHQVTRHSRQRDVEQDTEREVTRRRFPRPRLSDQQPGQAPKASAEQSGEPHREGDPSEHDPGHTGASRRQTKGRNRPLDTSEGGRDEAEPRHDVGTDDQSSERTGGPSDQPTQRPDEERHAIRRDRPTSNDKSIHREPSEIETEERPRDTVARSAELTDAGSRAGRRGDRRDESSLSRSESSEESDLTVRRHIRHQRPKTHHREDGAWSVVDRVQRVVPTIRPDDIPATSADRPQSLDARPYGTEWTVHRRFARPLVPDSDDRTGGSIGPEPPGMVAATSDSSAPLSSRSGVRDRSHPTAGPDTLGTSENTLGAIGMADPPAMKPLRAGLTPPGHLEQASVGGPSPGNIARSLADGPSTLSVAGVRTRNRTQSQSTQTIGDRERVNGDRSSGNQNTSNRSDTNRIEDIIDLNRLADRLARMLERKSRIERERRGR